jgi:hypothetical protein
MIAFGRMSSLIHKRNRPARSPAFAAVQGPSGGVYVDRSAAQVLISWIT